MQSINEMIKKLPSEYEDEVKDFIQFLMEKKVKKKKVQLKLGWRGALRDIRDQTTSLELQHKVLEWWGG
jgi:hypothetical protein